MENKSSRRLHPREEFLLKKKEEMEAALKFMKEKCENAMRNNDPSYKFYNIAIDAMLRQLLKVKRELR
jgi:hypothetical protein